MLKLELTGGFEDRINLPNFLGEGSSTPSFFLTQEERRVTWLTLHALRRNIFSLASARLYVVCLEWCSFIVRNNSLK